MTLEGMKKFLNALKTAGIKNWEGVNDIASVHYYNDGHSVNVLDESDGTLYNFSRPLTSSAYNMEKTIMVRATNLADVHEVAFGADFQQVKAFLNLFPLYHQYNLFHLHFSVAPKPVLYLSFW